MAWSPRIGAAVSFDLKTEERNLRYSHRAINVVSDRGGGPAESGRLKGVYKAEGNVIVPDDGGPELKVTADNVCVPTIPNGI